MTTFVVLFVIYGLSIAKKDIKLIEGIQRIAMKLQWGPSTNIGHLR